MKNKKQSKDDDEKGDVTCVRVRAQTEQLSGVVDGLRKKKNERKREKKKHAERFIRYVTINLSLCWFFLHREAIVAAGRYLSIYI
jgi:hypothetical protein